MIIITGRMGMYYTGESSIYLQENSRIITNKNDFKEYVGTMVKADKLKQTYLTIRQNKGNWVSF